MHFSFCKAWSRGFFLSGVIFLLGVGVFCFGSRAQALSLSPSIIEAHAKPGETTQFTVTLTNDAAEAVRVFPTIQKFVAGETGGQQRFLPPTDVTGLPSWTFVESASRTLQPNETQNVTVAVRVPAEAESGGQYEALFFAVEPVLNDATDRAPGVGLRTRLGALVLFTVEGDLTEGIEMGSWQLRPTQGLRDVLSGEVNVSLKNVGSTHLVPSGTLVIRNMFGKVVASEAMNEAGGRILPGTTREFSVRFGQGLGSEGSRSFFQRTIAELSNLGIGSYTISLEDVKTLDAPPAPLHFFVWPWRSLLSLGGALLFLGVLLGWYRARIIRRLQARST